MNSAEQLHSEDCRKIGRLLAVVGDKWAVVLLSKLDDRPMRFRDLREAVSGISDRMLTVTLRNLERDGFVVRTVYPTIPLRVEYALSQRGRDFKEALRPVGQWVIENRDDIDRSRRQFDSGAGGIRLSDGK